jgi:hypothetical protein
MNWILNKTFPGPSMSRGARLRQARQYESESCRKDVTQTLPQFREQDAGGKGKARLAARREIPAAFIGAEKFRQNSSCALFFA